MTETHPPTLPSERLFAVDMRGVPEERMERLRRLAIERGVPLSTLFAELIARANTRLLGDARAPRPVPSLAQSTPPRADNGHDDPHPHGDRGESGEPEERSKA